MDYGVAVADHRGTSPLAIGLGMVGQRMGQSGMPSRSGGGDCMRLVGLGRCVADSGLLKG